VSRVVNNDPRASLTDATRERIMSAVEELGYRPNAAGRSLRLARTGTIGLLVPDFSNPMYGRIARATEVYAASKGHGVVIGTHPGGEVAATFTELLRQGRVDGLIVGSGALKDTFLRKVIQTHPAGVVLVNRRVPGGNASVTMDDASGAALAAEQLIARGHRHVAGIFGPPSIDTSRRRQRGFEKVLAKNGITPVNIRMDEVTAEKGREAAARLLAEHPEVTGVFASVFQMGLGVLRAAGEAGRDVPGSLSVLALHDFEIADYLSPSLSCIRMPVDEMSEAAVDMMIAMIKGEPGDHVMVRTSPVLVERESLASAPQ
jgi:LacI family transcriptional regulator